MNPEITQEQIDRYEQDGFLLLPNFLSSDEVETLRAGVEAACSQLGQQKVAGEGLDWEAGTTYYDKVFTQRLNLWKINDTVRRFLLDEQLGKSLSRLAGVSGLRVWHDQALIKEPHANPTAWHLDNPYWSFHSREAITIWIALGDVSPQNGCMYFLPGSHKLVTYDNSDLGENFAELFDVYPELKAIEPVPAAMRAGDCSFHNGLTAHCAGPNVSAHRRMAMTCAYMPIGSSFNGQQNILPDAYVQGLEVGDALDDDDLNPLVYPLGPRASQ